MLRNQNDPGRWGGQGIVVIEQDSQEKCLKRKKPQIQA
ncbi:MAG: hypothetical protein CM1200mP28_06500 [Deltaproteobacteria bacterium]|nr:MAG: hypothetical protein CM1200mP28_06500 [Deltaproteobacteria bacterium]